MKYTAQVERGFALLNHVAPGWQASIDIDWLNMVSSYSCILGQVYESYQTGIETIFSVDLATLSQAEINSLLEHSARYGFSLSDPGNRYYKNYTMLKAAWIKALKTRKRKKGKKRQ